MNIDETLEERGNRHGDFKHNSDVAQSIKAIMECGDNWKNMPAYQKETLHMIAHKIGRILAGDNNFHDHWHDIIGYARLVERELECSFPEALAETVDIMYGSNPELSSTPTIGLSVDNT